MNKSNVIKLLVVICLLCVVALGITACKNVNMQLTFVVDGQEYKTIDTAGNEIIAIPQSPTKDGYTFDGWYWDEGAWQQPFTANSLLNVPLTSNMSVYAKFTEIHEHTYSIAWTSNELGHWRVATCEHTSETTAIEKHIYDSNYKCKICNYQDTSLHGTDLATEIFDIDGETLYAKVSNAQSMFSFINAIQVADGATFVVATDLAASNIIRTKTVSLEIGDNTYYILVENGNDIKLYTATLRRRPIYTLIFDAMGGTVCDSQQVEEDSFAVVPATTKTGYTFASWDYDFEQAVTANATVTASWTVNEYTVTYDINGGNLSDTQYTATYDSEYTLAVPTREGHTFLGWYVDETQITNANGQSAEIWTYTENKTVMAKWNINSYSVTINNLNGDSSVVSGGGTYEYANEVTVTAMQSVLGCQFDGWYSDDELVSDELSYSFEMPANDVILTVYNVNDEMSNFTFTSTHSACTITGVKDISIVEANIPEYVTNIGPKAFMRCNSLRSITIPENIKKIGYWAFLNCTSLRVINYNARYCTGFNTSNDSPFRNVGFGARVNIGEHVQNIPKYLFCGSNISSVVFAENSQCYSIEEGAFAGLGSLKTLTISASVKYVFKGAFANCTALTELYYNAANMEFYYDSNLEIKKNHIFYNAGKNGNGITLHIGTDVKGIQYGIFHPEYDNNSVNPNISSVIFYDSGNVGNAFYDSTSLTSITIPQNGIASSMFSNCSNLKYVFYKGSSEQWNANNLSDDAIFKNLDCYYYSETEPDLNADGTAYDGNYWHYDTDCKTPIIWKKEN